MGAPIGNTNSAKGKPWGEAINRALKKRELSGQGRDLNALAETIIDAALDGDMSAIKEIGDRLDGKATQPVDGHLDLMLTVTRKYFGSRPPE